MTERENYLRMIEFRNPERIPYKVTFSEAAWHKHREKLEELVLRHPLTFWDSKKGSMNFDVNFDEFRPRYREGEYYRDNWGCLWYNAQGGLEGQVVEHPLADWKALDTYKIPDSLLKEESSEIDWEKIKEDIEERKRKGLLTIGNIDRFFDRLHFLRGFENLMIDFVTDPSELSKLIELILENNMKLINKWLEIGVDIMAHHGDIGSQNSLMMSPEVFRKYLKPGYKKMFMTCRKAGVPVAYSSDGNLLSIVDDLIECGVSLHDPQLGVNTLEGIEKAYKGKLCACVDLSQDIIFWEPKNVKKQLKEVIETLGLPEGGLMFRVYVMPDVPLENIEAICSAFEQLRCVGMLW